MYQPPISQQPALTAYFDDSGTHSESEFACVVGLVSTDEQWTRFEGEWKSVLEEAELDHFHARKCNSRSRRFGRFRNYGELSERLAGLITRRVKGVVAVGANPDWCAEAIGLGRTAMKRDIVTVFGMSCIHSILIVRELLSKGHPTKFVFERGTRGYDFVDMSFRDNQVKGRYGISSIRTEVDKRVVQLQAADLYAWELRQDRLRRGDRPLYPSRAFHRLLKGTRLVDSNLNVDAFKRGIEWVLANPEEVEKSSRPIPFARRAAS